MSSQKLLEEALVESKYNTRNKKILKKKAMIEFEVPIEEVVPVEKSNGDDNEEDTKKDIDEDVAKNIAACRGKVKTGDVPPVKKTTNKGLIFTKSGSIVRVNKK